MKSSRFVISLDFELLWGVRDHADKSKYGENVIGAREVIPRILDLFAQRGVCATWATVGFLFCESKEELLEIIPPAEQRPRYKNRALSSYNYFEEVGSCERSDPYYFAPSLIRLISSAPGQEIGTHTLSHYYPLEEGQTIGAFEADLEGALKIAHRWGLDLRSIVFPRNQYSFEHLKVCQKAGLSAYRGNPQNWAYSSTQKSEQTALRRGLRLADAYTGVLGHHAYEVVQAPLRNVPASQFLRPKVGSLARLHPMHVRNIMSGMTAAARRGRGYHLWWHPHNFGIKQAENLAALESILRHYSALSDTYGMASCAMGTPD